MKLRVLSLAAFCTVFAGALGCSRSASTKRSAAQGSADPGAVSVPAAPADVATRAELAIDGELRFVVIGGGPTPQNNEVSLEQDVQLVSRALTGPGLVLFAGGSASPSVREMAEPSGDPLRAALGDLFLPRPGRQSRYRRPDLRAERATSKNVELVLDRALGSGKEPLFLYLAGHGDRGDTPKQNALALWAGGALTAEDLAAIHEQHDRALRVVATTCFSGGFAELAFARADSDSGRPASVARCGLFAGPADRETSGCDPNPDRRRQSSYGVYFIRALSKDVSGARPQGGEIDLDADGTVGLLEAHTWARIHARSFDLPTTTSERWLRRVQQVPAADLALLREENAVVGRLGTMLGILSEADLAERLKKLTHRLDALNHDLDEADAQLAQSEAELMASLLERWPVLDDPFHPQFEHALAQNRDAIAEVLQSSLAEQRARGVQRMDELYAELDRVSVDEALLQRVFRAYETLHLAAALRRRGGPDAEYYEQLLACERATP